METHLEAGGNWLPDTKQIIADAARLDERTPDLTLEEALEIIWGHGFADDWAGDVDTTNHVFRVGRHVLETDGQGFKTVHSYGTEDAAQELIDFVRDREADFMENLAREVQIEEDIQEREA